MSGTSETRRAGGRGAAWLATLLLVLACGATGRAEQAAPPKSGDTVASEAELTAGPWTATRARGKPAPVSFAFTPCDPGGRFWLKVANGAGGKPAVESAVVKLNGTEVLGPSAFDAHPADLARAVTVRAGENRLEVEARGTPGAALEVAVWAVESCLRVKITSPRANEMVTKRPVLITGEADGKSPPISLLVSFVIEEMASHLDPNSLAARLLREGKLLPAGTTEAVRGGFDFELSGVEEGSYRVQVVATDAEGKQATDEVRFLLESARPEAWHLEGDEGPAPLNVMLRPSQLGPYRVDFDGDGVIDEVGDTSLGSGHTEIRHTYETPGRYKVTVWVTTDITERFEGRVIVTEAPPVARIWQEFAQALAAGDLAKAKARVLSSELRDELDRLEREGKLAAFARSLAEAKFVVSMVQADTAWGTLVRRTESGENVASDVMFGKRLGRWGIVSY